MNAEERENEKKKNKKQVVCMYFTLFENSI